MAWIFLLIKPPPSHPLLIKAAISITLLITGGIAPQVWLAGPGGAVHGWFISFPQPWKSLQALAESVIPGGLKCNLYVFVFICVFFFPHNLPQFFCVASFEGSPCAPSWSYFFVFFPLTDQGWKEGLKSGGLLDRPRGGLTLGGGLQFCDLTARIQLGSPFSWYLNCSIQLLCGEIVRRWGVRFLRHNLMNVYCYFWVQG